MRGRKAELFVVDLSFIGWSILSSIPFVSLYTLPYMEVTYINYYDAIMALEHPERYTGGGPDQPGGGYWQNPGAGGGNDDSGRPPWEL